MGDLTHAGAPSIRVDSELELLTYLGMRRILRARPRTEVLGLARKTNARHGQANQAWRAGTNLPPMRVEGLHHLECARDGASGAVVALPHCGPYFRAALALVDRDFALTVLAERKTYDDESAGIERHVAAYRGSIQGTASEHVQILDTSRTTAAWETIVALRHGRIALTYYDNNFGIQSPASARTSAVFDLCGTPVVGRLGAPVIAGTAGVPLVPALARFGTEPGEEDVLELHAPLLREPGEELETFARRAGGLLFASLGREIERDPTAWDLWFGLIGRAPAPPTKIVEREPEMLEVLAMRVRLAEESLEELDTPYGRLVANLDRGTTVVRNETYDAIAEILAEGASVEKLVFDLNPVVGGNDVALTAIQSLVASGFLVLA